MLGTIVNAVAILVGGLAGLLLRGGIKQKYQTIANQAIGLSVLVVGLSGAIGKIMQPEANPVLFIVSLVLGGLLGELLGIEAGLEKLGNWLQGKIRTKKDTGNIADGFVAASLLFCVGTMGIMGALQSGMQGQHTTLFTKSVLDGITAVIMASTMGVGVLFSAVSVFIYQGAITLLAGVISPLLTADMLREILLVGGIMIAALGLNILGITKIKVGNMLPAILVPVVYYLVLGLFS
ncbi:DUF554 domain-containing protein [Ruminococcaceae bacterium OttesenSCG-928-A16]|nr:DUF554 domain-containing protein [Ruminococcaceae bacterium OttesenSCG-928-A16]